MYCIHLTVCICQMHPYIYTSGSCMFVFTYSVIRLSGQSNNWRALGDSAIPELCENSPRLCCRVVQIRVFVLNVPRAFKKKQSVKAI